MSITGVSNDCRGRDRSDEDLAADLVSAYLEGESLEVVVESRWQTENRFLRDIDSTVTDYLGSQEYIPLDSGKLRVDRAEKLYLAARILEDCSAERNERKPYWEVELDPKYGDETDFLKNFN